jgi:hypothetical protein
MLVFRLIEEAFTKGMWAIVAVIWLFIFVKLAQAALFFYKNRGRF